MSVRVRYAPSPTGYQHVGGARTALFNYLFAKKNKGSFILRIEDTDQDRSQESALIPLIESLMWLGLKWDEGLILKKGQLESQGFYGPYRQKNRISIYKEKALELIKKGKAYYCFMNLEEEALQKQQALQQDMSFKVSSPYRDFDLSQSEKKIQDGEPFCIRFKTEKTKQSYQLKDLVRGDVSFPGDSLGDFILIRRDGFPVYNFSCAVDDSLMKISHVFRGEEHLSNSLKQQMIQKALDFKCPQIGHLSIILDKNKKKLSKRTGSKSLDYYRQEGYLASALLNFLALLGWNSKTQQEFFYKEELIEKFNIKGLNSSSAIFDEDKLLWLNEKHLKGQSEEGLMKEIKVFLKNPISDKNLFKKMLSSLKSSFKTLKQSAQLLDLFLTDHFELNPKAKDILKGEKSKSLLTHWIAFLNQKDKDYLSLDDFKEFQKSQKNIKGSLFFKPLRCACIGQPEGVEIKILVELLSKKQLLQRAKVALKYTRKD